MAIPAFVVEPSSEKKAVDLTQVRATATTYSPYCYILECIALKLHCQFGSGDTESTTTIAWSPAHAALYLTSQGNSTFDGFGRPQLLEMLQAIHIVCESAGGPPGGAAKFFAEYCFKAQLERQPSDAKLQDRIYNVLHYTIEPNVERLRACGNIGQHLDALANGVRQVEVVRNEHLFSTGTPGASENTGFHGESRIVRFLYILYGGAVRQGALLGGTEPAYDRAHFATLVRDLRLYFGSSQGTCQDCRTCLDEFGFSHGPARLTRDRSPNWIDPLTLKSREQSAVSAYKHADRAIQDGLLQ